MLILQNPHQIAALAALLTTISAAVIALEPRAAAPEAVLVSYELPDCSETGAAGQTLGSESVALSKNNCTAIRPTTSFKGFLPVACPQGTSAEIAVYSKAKCSGNVDVLRGFTVSSSTCINDLAIGMSALFMCNSN